jgi:hypothetical protein
MVCVTLRPSPPLPPENEFGYARIRMLEVYKNRPGNFGVKINLLSLPGFKQRIIIPEIIRIIFLKKYIEFAN